MHVSTSQDQDPLATVIRGWDHSIAVSALQPGVDAVSTRAEHWDRVYRTRQSDEVSWFQPEPTLSLELISAAGALEDSSIIDIGGGDSTLVDALIARGFRQITVLDVSAAALDRARARLGSLADGVTWRVADVTRVELPTAAYDLWHDRAVFHFLVDPDERRRYVVAALKALRPGGTLIIATFALDGPTRCSGLEVQRYDAAGLAHEFGEQFELVNQLPHLHHTPSGGEQRFTFAVLRRV